MESRMERYQENHLKDSRRTTNNQNLYKTIYEMSEYSNVEGVATIPTTNEIDIRKVQELLKSREDYQKAKKVGKVVFPKEEESKKEEEDRNYDIRDILNKAKDERTEADNKYHNLKNTQYNILKNINIDEALKKEDYLDPSEDNLKELIQTITNTSMLNKLDNDELSRNMFADLTQDQPEEQDTKETKELEQTNTMDQSFYTSSFNFSKNDFEDIQNVKKKTESNSKMIKVILGIVLLFLAILLYFAFK